MWHKLLWKLGIVSHSSIENDIAGMFEILERQNKRIAKLHRALLSIKIDDIGSRERVNRLLTDLALFDEEMNQIPIFPYGNDSSRPK